MTDSGSQISQISRPVKAPLNTRTLLTCVAIAVASAILSTPFGWLVVATGTTFPPAYLALSGVQVFGSIIALRLLNRGGVGLVTSGMAGLIGVFAGPYGWGSLLGLMLFGAASEVPFLINLYRRWGTWRYYLAAVVAAAVWTPTTLLGFDYASFNPAMQILLAALPALSMLLFTWLGVLIADGLRRAGVGPKTRVQADETA